MEGFQAEQIIRAETVPHPFLVVIGGERALAIALNVPAVRLTIGRLDDNHLPLAFDAAVSGVHAAIERQLELLTVEDLGPSRNGTFVNGVQIHARTKLEDRDVVRFGRTELTVRCGVPEPGSGTEFLPPSPDWTSLTPNERRLVILLVDLWPPELRMQEPPGNAVLAEHMGVGVQTVRTHFKAVFRKLGRYGVHNDRVSVAEAASLDENALRAAHR